MIPRVVISTLLTASIGVLTLGTPVASAARGAQGREKQILATVLDASGNAITGLGAADFTVHEDAASRQVTAVEPASEPLALAVLIDTSAPPQGNDAGTRDLRKALTSFVAAVHDARDDTTVSLTEFGGAAVLRMDFTKNLGVLDAVLSTLTPDMRPTGVLLEALIDTSKRFETRATPRRVILSIDFDSSDSSRVLPSKVSEAVEAAGASLWDVSVQRSGDTRLTGDMGAPVREAVLNSLPGITGGQHLRVIGTSALESTLLKLAGAFTHQYEITYVRPDSRPVTTIKVASPRGAKTLMSLWVR